MTELKRPAGLGAVGRRLWTGVLDSFVLDEREAVLLGEACRMLDETERLRRELERVPVLDTGSAGQARPHPLFAELRHHRQALARLLGQLGLEDAAAAGTARSAQGRRLAALRWKHGA